MIGNGKEASFWHDNWCGEVCLKSSYPRLFSVAACKNRSVADAGRFEGDCWIWNLRWRCFLFQWEEDLCNDLMGGYNPLNPNEVDSWCWSLEKDGGFSVSYAYGFLHHEAHSSQDCYSNIWNSLIPTKVSSLMWKIMMGKMPTREALKYRKIIPPQCVGHVCVLPKKD
ncbi:hypothetical protein RIF29_00571 [Crotalaria pallida]|uniref:Reverse transcriptase zinc-binding domain-containing protein n=1 Tax=Crotalaria pallida TaxID=3830 RepID=A0AAN9P6M9_CROPI